MTTQNNAILYTNAKGLPVTVHSYSSGKTFEMCAYKYAQERVHGWKEKGHRAALEFGKAVESAIQFYHENGLKPDTGVDYFKMKWLVWKDNEELIYSAKEGDWKALYLSGSELLALYEIVLPTLPITNPAWQVSYRREVFPNSDLAGLEHTAFADMISRSPWVHPLLPKVDIPKGSAYRPLLVDLKTSAVDLDVAPEMLALDPQLRQYAWTSGIQDVAFMWLVKAKTTGHERGTEVTMLKSAGLFNPGDKATVIFVRKVDDEEYVQKYNLAKAQATEEWMGTEKELKKAKEAFEKMAAPNAEEAIGCIPSAILIDYEEGAKEKRGKALEEFKAAFVAEYGEVFSPSLATKTRIQFIAGRISNEDMLETGNLVGRQIVEIVEANKNNQWSRNPSIRFPDQKCTWCSHRGFCVNRPDLVDKMLVQIKHVAAEPDWLDDLVAVEE